MAVVVWIAEGTWRACVDAAREYATDPAEVVLLHVSGHDVADAAHGAFAGLLGRADPGHDPGTRLERMAADAARHLLDAAADRLGRPCTRLARTGRPEHEVVEAARDATLLILGRDGDTARPGPKTLRPPTRFVVDHAPCPVLLVWP
ncbi:MULTISPECIES: universal stress protein [unclassified Streptomyces]|jgi:nucleotide-binding universal stress UspA family protein|uniref:universal stress protein n=1 Tax=unclassified Streptomyces TaxID=2593676 RepID=UPI00367A6AB5